MMFRDGVEQSLFHGEGAMIILYVSEAVYSLRGNVFV